MANQLPEHLINFTVFLEGTRVLGVADVELPKLEAMKQSVSGAGIAGELEVPVIGHYGPMSASIKFRTITADAAVLAKPAAHLIDFRGSQQVDEAGAIKTVPVRVTLKATPMSTSLGKFEVGKTTETAEEFSVSYIKMYVDGKEVIEIDPLNFVAKFNGEDMLSSAKKDLGL